MRYYCTAFLSTIVLATMRCFTSSFLAVCTALMLLASSGEAFSQETHAGLFEGQSDVGAPLHPGAALYDPLGQTYTLEGSGANMWLGADQFHFLWRKLKGNFILSARVRFIGPGVEAHRKAGWIVRSTLEPGSRHVNASLHGDGLMALQWRRIDGDSTRELRSAIQGPDEIQLERKGNRYIMSVARSGDTLSRSEIADLPLGDEVYVGLYVCAHNEDVTEKAVYSNVRITIPPADDFVPYKDFLGSDLEILEVKTGNRSIVHRSPGSLQAPNWLPDGKTLLYNQDGRLFRFDLSSGKVNEVNTGFASSNNNDHVLSFDGKMIGISHHSTDDGNKSIVYVLPVGGGVPQRVTRQGPSYLHGWSPDGKSVVFTGERRGEFDIYRIPVAGGEETRLTSAKGLDDGPEFTPAGDFIYFNSSRSGRMQIWRMRPDGSGQEQVTHDELNNWFPHISPDGKWIVFLSFGRDVNPEDHPFYRHVYIRLMPAGGGPSRVVAYVFGGQGTMNVPSWSPDGTKLAFVSNTNLP